VAKSKRPTGPTAAAKPPPAPSRRRRILKRVLLGLAIALPVTLGATWYAANHVPWFGAWLADSLRSVLGTDNVAELEVFAYGLEDRWNRFFRSGEKPKQYWDAPTAQTTTPAPPPSLSASSPAAPGPATWQSNSASPAASAAPATPPFRPADIGPLSPKIAAPGDGIWVPVPLPESPTEPPLLYKTLLHPDTKRPWAELFIVAIDLRRARLFSVAGKSEPRGTAPGSREAVRPGLIPDAHRPDLVAGFNGGFKEEHGHYGMKIGGILLVPPRKDACTVAALPDGTPKIASWKALEPTADTLVWWRQTPACLVENAKLHPALYDENTNWGAAIGGGTVVRRSAIALDPERTTLYVAVSNSTSPRTLAIGMQHTGATDVAQLDINFSYPRFVLFQKTQSGDRETVSLFEGFKADKGDYLATPSPRDFFYLTRNRTSP